MTAQLDTLAEKIESIARKLLPYSGFDGQYINGDWRPGHANRKLKDTDPYTGESVAEIALADQSDLEVAYQSALKAQPAWASRLPAERAEVLGRCADLMEKRGGKILIKDGALTGADGTPIPAQTVVCLKGQNKERFTLASRPFRPTDVDYFVFTGKKGQRVVVSCLASTVDSRLRAATELFQAGKVDYLLVSGDNHTKGYDEATDMREGLLQAGIPAKQRTPL